MMTMIIIIAIPFHPLYFNFLPSPKMTRLHFLSWNCLISRGILICKNDSHFCIHIHHQVKRQAMIILLLRLTIHENLWILCWRIEKTKVTVYYTGTDVSTDDVISVNVMVMQQQEGRIQKKKTFFSWCDITDDDDGSDERERKQRNKRWDDREQQKEQNRKKKEMLHNKKKKKSKIDMSSEYERAASLFSDSGDPWFLPLFRSCLFLWGINLFSNSLWWLFDVCSFHPSFLHPFLFHSCLFVWKGRKKRERQEREKQHPRPTWTSHTQNEEEDVKREEVRREVQDYDQPSVFFQYWFSQYQKEMCKREEKANTRKGRRGTWKRKKTTSDWRRRKQNQRKTSNRRNTHTFRSFFRSSSGERTCLLLFLLLLPSASWSLTWGCPAWFLVGQRIQRYKNPVSS